MNTNLTEEQKKNISFYNMWEILENYIGVSEETIYCVTNINGRNTETMQDILYAMTGYRNFEQAQEEYGYNLKDYSLN